MRVLTRNLDNVAKLARDPTELLQSGVLYCRFKDKDTVIERFQTMKAGY